MLISDSHQFIFVHIRKAAGSSIRRLLAPYARCQPRGFWKRVRSRALMTTDYRDHHFRAHTPLKTAEQLMDPSRYARYFKFAIVRNPWERLLSEYRYVCGTPDHIRHFRVAPLSFAEFCRFQSTRSDAHQHLAVRDSSGQCGLDFVGRFESLVDDVNTVCSRLGIDVFAMPHINRTFADDYAAAYDNRLRKFVADAWKQDIEIFNYRFGASSVPSNTTYANDISDRRLYH